jgi:hypothetical protein
MYTILLYENKEWKICFDGSTPILGDLYNVIGKRTILQLSNPEATYKIAKVEIL